MKYNRVILHVGTGRTGTSTIQTFLERNRLLLHKHDFDYAGPNDLVSCPQEEGCWDEGGLSRGLRELKQRMQDARTGSMIWSRESLSTYDFIKSTERVRMIKDAFPASHPQVVIYLRRQDHYLRSAYLQWGIKDKTYPGPTRKFDESLALATLPDIDKMRHNNLDYDALVKPWIDVFGHENVTVRIFEKDQLIEGNLLRDFCHAAELPQIDYDFDVANANVSYNMELHDMLGMYNSVFEKSFASVEMINFFDTLGMDPFFSQKYFSQFSISPKCRIEILRHCEESNRKVAKEYMGRADGVLFREPWPSANDPHEPYPGLTMEKLVPILLQILQKQGQRIDMLERRVSEIEAKNLELQAACRLLLEKDRSLQASNQNLNRCSNWLADLQQSRTWRWFARFTVGKNPLPIDVPSRLSATHPPIPTE
jgi:hypothetical protein